MQRGVALAGLVPGPKRPGRSLTDIPVAAGAPIYGRAVQQDKQGVFAQLPTCSLVESISRLSCSVKRPSAPAVAEGGKQRGV